MAGWRVRADGELWTVAPPSGSHLEQLLASGTPNAYRHPTRRLALESLVSAASLVAEGLLPELWQSDQGIAFSEPTGPERDFTNVAWSWRNPEQTLVPLMLQQVTADGHADAELAGFVEQFTNEGGTIAAQGRFYDNEAGRAFRDLLLDGRRFGVSVDPGENTDAEWQCTQQDADGFCTAGKMSFSRYEIAGLTGTPFPGFAQASIRLAAPAEPEPAPAAAPQPAIFASAGPQLLLRYDAPPAEWFSFPEPEFIDDLFVEQEDGSFGVPLTITDAGQVFGHVARWGQCHTGYPGECVQAPPSRSGYAGFHLGQTRCADGSLIPTGVLTAGCDHAAIRLRAPAAREHYDNSGVGWATVRMTDAAHGIWCCGALRPDTTQEQADLLRSLSLSGDWRRDRGSGSLEMLAVLAVNVPGFPQQREPSRLLASATVSQPAAYWADDLLESLTSSGIVRRCASCAEQSPLSELRAELAAANLRIDQLARLALRPRLG